MATARVTISLPRHQTVYDMALVALTQSPGAEFITAGERPTQGLSSLPSVRLLGQVVPPPSPSWGARPL